MGVYQELINAVENGARYDIDIPGKTICIGRRKNIILHKEFDGDLGLEPCDPIECMSNIEKLYFAYKMSYPSMDNQKHSRYFPALSHDDMEDIDLVKGENRNVAQVKLEGYVLCSILNGSLQFDESWYWQSKTYPELILFKSWLN